jgi:hypothetical protein
MSADLWFRLGLTLFIISIVAVGSFMWWWTGKKNTPKTEGAKT